MAIASTAFNTATTAINTISNLSGMGGKAMNMARGFMGDGGIPQAVSQVEVGMSNISASTSLARKGAMNSIQNISRQIKTHQQYGNLSSGSGNSAWGSIPSASGGASSGGMAGSGIAP